MISVAVILDSLEPAADRLLGLSPLLRLILTTAATGTKEFVVVTSAARFDTVAALKKDFRVKRLAARVHACLPGDFPRTPPTQTSRFWLLDGRMVVLPQQWHRLSQSESNKKMVVPAQSVPYAIVGLAISAWSELGAYLQKNGDQGMNPDLISHLCPRPESIETKAAGDSFVLLDSEEKTGLARRLLLASARKSTDGFIARHLNRPMSLAVTRLLINLPLRPVHLSLINLAVAILAAWFVGRAGYVNAFLGGLFFQLNSVLDGCDGENARLTFQGSDAGARFDEICDILSFVLFFINLPIGVYADSGDPLHLWAGLGALVSVGVFYVILARFVHRIGMQGSVVQIVMDIRQRGRRGTGLPGLIDRMAAWIAFIYRHDVFAFIFFVGLALGLRSQLLWTLLVLTMIESLYLQYYARRRLREARSGQELSAV